MADDIQVQSQGPGGNGFSVDLKQRSLGITGPIVIPVICLLLVGVLGWIRSVDLKESFAALGQRQEQIRAELRAQDARVDQQTIELRTEVHEQTVELRTSIQANLTALAALREEFKTLLTEHTKVLTQHLDIHDWNQDRALEMRLPLSVPPEGLYQQPRPR